MFLNLWRSLLKRRKKIVDIEEEQNAPSQTICDLDVISIEIGYALIPLVDEQNGVPLVRQIGELRQKLINEQKKTFPKIRLADNMTLAPTEFRILVKGKEMFLASVNQEISVEEQSAEITKNLLAVLLECKDTVLQNAYNC